MTDIPIDFPRLTRNGAGRVSTPNIRYNTGSALLDDLVAERARIWKVFLGPYPEPAPFKFKPIVPEQDIKYVEDRVADAWALHREISNKAINNIATQIRKSDAECKLNQKPRHSMPPNIISIQKLVANHFNITVRDIVSKWRTKDLVWPRHIAMYLSKELTDKSTTQIGRMFGNRDHTTVLNALDTITELVKKNKLFAEEIATLRGMLRWMLENE